MQSKQSKSYTVITTTLIMGLTACSADSVPNAFEPHIVEMPSIAATGSMTPRLSLGVDGTIIISWLEPRGESHALRYALYKGTGWVEASTAASGDNWFINWADFPSVVPLPNGLLAAHWLVRQSAGGFAYDINVATSRDTGKNWSEPAIAHSDGTETEHGFASLYASDDNVGLIYLDGRKQANEFTDDPYVTAMTLRAAVLTPGGDLEDEQLVDNMICDCCQTNIAKTSAGLITVYRNRTEEEIRDIYVTRQVNGQWIDGVPIAKDNWKIYGCPVNGPAIAASGSQVGVAWFSAPDDQPVIRAAFSSNSGESFSAPLTIANGAVLGHVGITLDSSGDAWIIWQSSAGDGEAELSLGRTLSNQEAGPAHSVVAKGRMSTFSVPQIVASEDALILAWTEGDYGETRIVTAQIPLPGH